MPDLSGELNEAQQQAINCTEGPLLILAGAGSGKTRVLTCRIAHLLEEKGVAPWKIMALTFTNKAAEEMRSRLERLVGDTRGMWVSTFHAAAVRILREHAPLLDYEKSFVIYDDTDQQSVIKSVLKELNMDNERFKPRAVLYAISRAKNELKDADLFAEEAESFYDRSIARVFRGYQECLVKNCAMDFDDLLLLVVKLFRRHPEVLDFYQEKFRYILVDEYQDTNRAQYEIVRLLASKHRNLCVVGDDDQSIYQFRGADLRNILDFERDWRDAKVVKLEENYRSTGNILTAAYHVVRNNQGRKEKKLWTRHAEGDPVFVFAAEDETGEARFIAGEIKLLSEQYGQFAILYRTNAQSRVLENVLSREGLPYQMVGGIRFWERREVKDLRAYLKVLDNPADDLSLQRIINVPRRGIGAATVQRLQELARQQQISLYQSLALAESAGSGAAAGKKTSALHTMLENLTRMKEYLAVDELVAQVLEQSGYLAELRAEGTLEAEGRAENLREFLTEAQNFVRTAEDKSLTAFLTRLSLISDLDTLADADAPQVTLMTFHAAKGLEFPVVFLAGLEEGLLPHQRSLETADGLEEERRLCYVGLTRAERRVYLSHARRRHLFGQTLCNLRSRFLSEIPSSVIAGSSEPAVALPPPSAPGRAVGLLAGDTVEHGKWGIGEVRAVDQLSDGDTVLTIYFPALGLKKVIARYAPLRKVN